MAFVTAGGGRGGSKWPIAVAALALLFWLVVRPRHIQEYMGNVRFHAAVDGSGDGGGGGGGGGNDSSAAASSCNADMAAAIKRLEAQLAEAQKAADAAKQAAAAGAGAGQAAQPGGGWRGGPHAATTAYQPGLSPRELDHGIVSYGEAARARRALARLARGEPISVGFIGGSVTWGQGSHKAGETDYVSRVFAWIRETFPRANHTLVNGAIPASPSSYFSLCNRWHLPADADLIVVEANINDGPYQGDHPMRRAHERLLRKLLQYERRPAVLELVFYRYPTPNWNVKEFASAYRYHGDDEIGVAAQYYHLPWLSARSLAWPYLPETAQDPANTTRTDKLARLWVDIARDGDHPSELGHTWLADLIIHWMQQTLDGLDRRPLEEADEEEAQAELSAPMWAGNWESKNNTCLMGTLLQGVVREHTGFEWVNEGTEQKPKWGYVSTVPGSELRITLSTNTARGADSGNNASLAVGFLKSYEHMGAWEMACVAGCACEPLKRSGHNKERNSQMHQAFMTLTAADECQLRFTVLNETESGEHKVKLIGLVISEVADWMVLQPEDRIVDVLYDRGAGGKGSEFGRQSDE